MNNLGNTILVMDNSIPILQDVNYQLLYYEQHRKTLHSGVDVDKFLYDLSTTKAGSKGGKKEKY